MTLLASGSGSHLSWFTLGVIAVVFGAGQLALLKRLPPGHRMRKIGFVRHFSDRGALIYAYADIAVGLVVMTIGLVTRG